MPALTVEFEQTEDDIVEFQRHHIRRGSQRWRALLPAGAVLAGAFLAGLTSVLMAVLRIPEAAVLLAVVAALEFAFGAAMFAFNWFALPHVATWRILTSPEQRTMLIGSRAIVVAEGGLAWRYPGGQSRMGWNTVNRVECDSGGVYIYFGPANAIWVPGRAFRSPVEQQEFGDAAQRYLAAYRSAASPDSAPA